MAGALVALWLLVAPGVAQPAATDTVDPAALREAIRMAGEYLVRVCDSNGRFEYIRHPSPFVKVRPSYNMLRHAGTMYALADYHRWSGDAQALAAIERAAVYMRTRCLKPVEGADGALAIWSGREIDGDSGPARAKLGGAGLGLVAFTHLERLKPGSVPREEMAGIGRFILFLQRDDGSFVMGFTPSEGGKDADWQSLFYPGEAALGLCLLSDLDGERRWREAALRAMKYLALSRKGSADVPADHWALIATAQLLQGDKDAVSPEDRALLLAHARQICLGMLQNKDDTSADPVIRGAWDADGRTTPTAIRVEGLVAILDLASEGDDALRQEILKAIDAAVAFLIRSQVRDGLLAGGIPKTPKQADLAKDPTAAEIRIDYVQHALSAFLGYGRRLGLAADGRR